MHILDAADSSGGLYVAGPPRTVLGRHYLNAMGREIIKAIVDAGITLRASGVADAAASYEGQLSDAIKRLGWRSVNLTYTMGSMAETLSPNTDVFGYMVEESTTLPDGVLTIDSDPVTENMFITIYNLTPSYKILRNVDASHICDLAPGGAVMLHGRDNGVDIVWAPIGQAGDKRHTIAAEWRIGGARTLFNSANIRVTKFAGGGLVHYNIPDAFAVTIPLNGGVNPSYIDITAAGDTGFPSGIFPAVGETYGGFIRLNDQFGNGIPGVYQIRTSERVFRLFTLDGSDIEAGGGSAIGSIRVVASLY